ncbi:MAG: hypothetical protein M3466_05415 [Gemmatimonadota bacterium]|nr:hypothetical protein [Gemmatimonadota bacterium]
MSHASPSAVGENGEQLWVRRLQEKGGDRWGCIVVAGVELKFSQGEGTLSILFVGIAGRDTAHVYRLADAEGFQRER